LSATPDVTSLDAASKTIRCADGFSLRYDAALLAAGATPVLPKLPGVHLANVFLLRSKADADAILAQAECSERAVILGASFIGMEVAASLRERGLQVTVVGKEEVPFEKQLGARVGKAFVGLHQKRGVGFRLGQEIQALAGESTVHSVTLSNGERLTADLVVIGFGVKPVTDYLEGVPLNEDGSVTVDANLRVAEGLYAAGDIARFKLRTAPQRLGCCLLSLTHGRPSNTIALRLPFDKGAARGSARLPAGKSVPRIRGAAGLRGGDARRAGHPA
jgi:apoptosis-inducing factor 3